MTNKTRDTAVQMVLNAPDIPASEKAELLELLAGDGDEGEEETIGFNAASQTLGIQLYNVYRLAAVGELKIRKFYTVKTALTAESVRDYLAKHGKGSKGGH